MTARPSPSAAFERTGPDRFRATALTQGTWRPDEMHVAPALGLLAHRIEQDRDVRRDDRLQLGRISFDILGTLPVGDLETEVRVVRAGRTIELVEAVLAHDGRPAVLARAWLMQIADTAALAGSGFEPMPPIERLPAADVAAHWPGAFVGSVEVRREEREPGRARSWVRPGVPLVEGETVGPTARLLGLVDIANGLTPRVPPTAAAYPNLDLTAHLVAVPDGEWIGFDTTVTMGATGLGTTHSVLHDANGPIGTSVQSLTVRPR